MFQAISNFKKCLIAIYIFIYINNKYIYIYIYINIYIKCKAIFGALAQKGKNIQKEKKIWCGTHGFFLLSIATEENFNVNATYIFKLYNVCFSVE